ncbi:MAG: lipid-A-disaccharide synthase [Desulfarculaceae bacterium]|nr:lipid-A-disaccharide synthase [Desulfarculaceae bacterium]MCF8046656.1 lipid-A-disaccharide synthase [Desulfarculaceae bacterium]MCF8065580.1 lipid-A-disaccharide synthase [Desulfarculaceae bacterium]MCF8096842.1 lipid-A-disaccharide synthase [Desulfarculaceae bacterium]MCF8121848.1 lipid-A-disaccharide synthase [Desulfarculaceae bacterium]
MAEGRSVVLVAGEASGDQHGARLARELAAVSPDITISGIGGPKMEAAGVELLYRSEDLALVGVAEVLPKLRVILGAIRGMKRHMKSTRPDAVILVDFPDFNFRVGKAAKKLGLKVLYYISPQVWAWRPKRAQKMATFVNHLACVFPFEPEFFKNHAPQLPVSFVGHPLLDIPPQQWDEPLPVPQEAELVGLLPGSRMSEISRLLPLLLASARCMQKQRPGLHFVLPLAPGLRREQVEPYLKNTPRGLTVLAGRARQVMEQAKLLLVASGTATLQAALAGTPGVVVYKTGGFNYLVARSLIKVEYIAMPNLIAGRELMPELIQGEATPEKVAAEALSLLDDDQQRGRVIQGLNEVRAKLGGPGASRRVAELALEIMEG